MADKRLLDALNESIAREMAVAVQYMWHHVMATGPESEAIGEVFKKTSINEMKHAEKFAERLDYLGGVPTTKPSDIRVGGDIKKMLEDNLKAEQEAIQLYKKFIKLCIELDDPVTRRLYEEVLADEEEHDNTFRTLLGK